MLDEAFAELAARNAKAEALLRAFEASGKTVAEFAEMYGMDPSETGRSLERARGARRGTGVTTGWPAPWRLVLTRRT